MDDQRKKRMPPAFIVMFLLATGVVALILCAKPFARWRNGVNRQKCIDNLHKIAAGLPEATEEISLSTMKCTLSSEAVPSAAPSER